MSFDVRLLPPDGGGGTVEVGNTTYNHSPAWGEALGYRFRDLDGKWAGQVFPELYAAADRIKEDPEKYEALVRGDGSWGTAVTAEEFLRRMADLCERHFNCKVEIT